MLIRKHLPRRTFLQGAGALISLPLLDAMIPAFAQTKTTKPPLLMAFVYVPNGIIMPDWTPAQTGKGFDLPHISEPLTPYRENLLLISGLTLNGGRALGDGPGDHARAAASFLTGAHPRKTAGADIHNGVSVDQFAAQQIGKATRFPSLELGCEDGKQAGNCDSGYSCAYSNSLAWRSPTTPLPPEVNPRAVFERLFGDQTDTGLSQAKRELYQKSILDFVREDTQKLQGKLGANDRRKLDEYLSAVREIERRIESAERANQQITPTLEKPTGIPLDFAEHVGLMFDLLLAAFQTDSTRIVTLMVGREGSGRSYREIGIPDAHHPLTHHKNDPEMVDKVRRINRYHAEQFAAFVSRLKATKDAQGSLMENVLVLYGSGLSDGNRHQHNELPVVLVGNRALTGGRHVRYPQETPMTNLYLAMLEQMGVQTDSFGDSKARLDVFHAA
jgi:hypothetical protein